MSNVYSVVTEIQGISAGRINAVIDAIHRAANWEIRPEGWWTEETAISIESDVAVGFGETVFEFAVRLARSAWGANSGYCPITITLDHPHYVLAFNESDYFRLGAAVGQDGSRHRDAHKAPATSCPAR